MTTKIHIQEVNQLRYLIFCQLSDNNLRKLPPSKEALRRHILRSTYVGGWEWGSVLNEGIQILSPIQWGWKFDNDILAPDWCQVMTGKLDDYVFTCSCKLQCTRCKCSTRGFACLPYCSCSCKCLYIFYL